MTRLALTICLAASALVAWLATSVASPTAHRSGARLVDTSYRSRAVRGREHYAVYLPAGYGSGHKRYPVIYALHGLPNDANGYREMSHRQWGNDAAAVRSPAIVVSPQGARRGDSDPEWHDWGPGRNWETLVAKELVARIDRAYRTIANRRGRAIIGVSAGGYGASIIGMRNPRVFSVIQSWSGYFHATNREGDGPLELGSPEADTAASLHSYLDDAKRIADSDAPFSFGFFVGDADPHFLAENQQLHRELLRAGVPHLYAVYRGAHSSAFWAAHEQTWIRVAARALARAH